LLGSNEGAEDAVQSAWLTASRNPPRFEHEGAFRSWLLRILIDEAFVVRRKKKELPRHARCGKASESDSGKCVYEVESTQN
jgi:DNA-directed RNA polymerase specialized sigma24 family protein